MVNIRDLKIGKKYYWFDGLVYTLLETQPVSSTQTKFIFRPLYSRSFFTVTVDVTINQACYMLFEYKRRDKSSFAAGFKRAVEYCGNYMDAMQQATACIDNVATVHMTMNQHYDKWKKNIE